MNEKYPKLFSKEKIGKLELKNRVVMPAMATALNSINGEVTDRIIAYYEARAAGGCGLIITEITRINDGSAIGSRQQLNATNTTMIPGLERLADAVHRHNGRIFTQLHHPGREGRTLYTGKEIVGPSAIMAKGHNEMPRELTTEEVEGIVQDFINAARVCQMAGIDGVELHGAHGYLIQQFMAEYSNHRTDKYGGSFENRMRFPKELFEGIKKACGENFPVIIRINGDDYFEGGLTLDDAVEIAKALDEIGYDAINVSAGGYAAPNEGAEPITYPQGWKRNLGKRIKENVKTKVIACDVIRKPEFAEELLEVDNLDFVALGRAQLADPEWCNKAETGNEEDIRPCISCLHCIEEVGMAHCIKCAVNPVTARETVYTDLKKDGNGRTVAVIGGGPAGMEAAITLAQREFKVVLYEKGNLGGALNLGAVPPNKVKLQWLIDNMIYQMNKANVEVRKEEATIEKIKALDPYAVFYAVGGKPVVPPFPGVNGKNVYTVDQVLTPEFTMTGKNIIVVGSGFTGLEVAEQLATLGNTVKVIEKDRDIAPGLPGGIRRAITPNLLNILKILKKLEIPMETNTELKAITEKGITVMTPEGEKNMPADAVVLSLGVRADAKVTEAWNDAFQGHIHFIGDVVKQGRVNAAIRTAYEAAYYLR